jgi:tRNA uracil 4-sulfurtransferase
MNSIVVHYQEIALKGRNRPWFISRLVHNIRTVTSDLDVTKVRPLMGRIEVVLGPSATYEQVGERLSRVFGVANYSRAGRAPVDVDAVASAILANLGDRAPASFRVSAKRGDKRFPLTSPEIEREVGGRIKQARGWKVDLSHPEMTIWVEFLPTEVFYTFGKEPGAGGLPTGASGRVACLISGGIDSPVAAYRLMRRGCQVLLVHFHSYPFLSHASQEKVRDLARLLTRYQLKTKLHLVPFGEIQRQIVLAVPPPLRVVIYRRFMVRIAEVIARGWSAGALVTGEVIGQVASQTLENMSIISSVATLPILRPLVGMDKEEITEEAARLGTFPISIVPDQDCCQLFTPRHPATRAKRHDVEEAERGLPVDDWVRSAVEQAETEELFFPRPQEARATAQ